MTEVREKTVKIPFKWERLVDGTSRAKVYGGWVLKDIEVRTTRTPEFWATAIRTAVGTSLCFIPDPEHKWET